MIHRRLEEFTWSGAVLASSELINKQRRLCRRPISTLLIKSVFVRQSKMLICLLPSFSNRSTSCHKNTGYATELIDIRKQIQLIGRGKKIPPRHKDWKASASFQTAMDCTTNHT